MPERSSLATSSSEQSGAFTCGCINDFVLIGPKADGAKIKGGKDIVAALTAISTTASPFVSRGDKSGTHAAELALWKAANLDPAATKPSWYREIGQGMGADGLPQMSKG